MTGLWTMMTKGFACHLWAILDLFEQLICQLCTIWTKLDLWIEVIWIVRFAIWMAFTVNLEQMQSHLAFECPSFGKRLMRIHAASLTKKLPARGACTIDTVYQLSV